MRGRRPVAGDPRGLSADGRRPAGALSEDGSFDPDAPGLYLHVPFCSQVCPYCDFAVSVGGEASRRRYLAALEAEIALWESGWHLSREIGWHLPSGGSENGSENGWHPGFGTVYLGGGTPSWLRPEELAAVLAALAGRLGTAGAWIQLEANPEDVTAEALAAWKGLGVRALSLGVQSFDDQALAFLGRRHTAEESRQAVERALAAGFDNVSLDLIYGLPGQSEEALGRELETAVALAPHHISCYQLTIEPRTVFGHRAEKGDLEQLPEPEQAAHFRLVHSFLAAAGYPAYEVSNFAKGPEHRSRHNRKYWRHVPYLGLGPSAHSYDGQRKRWWNERSLAAWRQKIDQGKKPIAGEETLGDDELALEALMLGLRTAEGIALEAFRRRHGVDLLETDGDLIAKLVSNGQAVVDGGRLALTLDGLVLAEGLTTHFTLRR